MGQFKLRKAGKKQAKLRPSIYTYENNNTLYLFGSWVGGSPKSETINNNWMTSTYIHLMSIQFLVNL